MKEAARCDGRRTISHEKILAIFCGPANWTTINNQIAAKLEPLVNRHK